MGAKTTEPWRGQIGLIQQRELDEPRWLFQITPTVLKTSQGVEWRQRYRVTSLEVGRGDDASRRV